MKKLIPVIVLMLLNMTLFAQTATPDTLTREEFIRSQTVKSDTLNQMALKLAVPGASQGDLNKAINLIMSGLHTYSKFRDSTGLRETFDHLAIVYHLQKKYVQAKWFYIQSNTYARDMKDTANIIKSLMALSTVKADIKDFDMADRDLTEALYLAKTQRGIDPEIAVQNSIAEYYTKRGIPKKIDAAINRITFLKDSVAKRNVPKVVIVKKQPEIIKTKPVITQGDHNTNRVITVIVVLVFLLLLLMFLMKGKRKNVE